MPRVYTLLSAFVYLLRNLLLGFLKKSKNNGKLKKNMDNNVINLTKLYK